MKIHAEITKLDRIFSDLKYKISLSPPQFNLGVQIIQPGLLALDSVIAHNTMRKDHVEKYVHVQCSMCQ
jgi:hypothetical protein